MTEQPISAETHYVATMIALKATQALATNLAAYLAGVAEVDGTPSEEGRACARRLLDDMIHAPLDTAVTDLRPGSYDAEMARNIALDTLQTYNAFVLGNVL